MTEESILFVHSHSLVLLGIHVVEYSVKLFSNKKFGSLVKENILKSTPRFAVLILLINLLPLFVYCQKTADVNVDHLMREVEASPENVSLHEKLIRSLGGDHQRLIELYGTLQKRFRNSAILPFVVGRKLSQTEDPKAEEFLLKAVALKPDLAEAWHILKRDAFRWSKDSLGRIYAKNAAGADPKNPDYAFQYAYSYRNIDNRKFDSLSLDVVRRFPKSEQASQALYWLADNSRNEGVKISYYKQLQKLYLKYPSDEGRTGMSAYYDLLIRTNPGEAYQVALEMVLNVKVRALEWQHKLRTAKAFIEARQLLDENNAFDANRILNNIELNSRFSASFIEAKEELLLLKAEAQDAMHQTRLAYDSIAVYYSKEPTVRLYNALLKYGTKLSIDTVEIKKGISLLRTSAARPAHPFVLESYVGNKKVRLEDFKGKIVLVTFWFPSCSPCLAEFPHFESVLKKFSKDQVAYLGINGVRNQDNYVVPLMKSLGYSFIPLKEDVNRNNEYLKADGFPTNYLLDRHGRIVFSDFRIDASNEKTLEIMIEELLGDPK